MKLQERKKQLNFRGKSKNGIKIGKVVTKRLNERN